jgi:hypothetical protein
MNFMRLLAGSNLHRIVMELVSELMRAALANLDEGEFTEGHELPGKWKVAKQVIGRRLSQEEAKRLLAKFDCILSRPRRCNSHAGRAKPHKYKSGRPFLRYTYRQLPELLSLVLK